VCRLGPGPRRGGTKSSLLHASTRLGARISTIQVARDLKKLMFNDAMTMGACSERMQVAMFD